MLSGWTASGTREKSASCIARFLTLKLHVGLRVFVCLQVTSHAKNPSDNKMYVFVYVSRLPTCVNSLHASHRSKKKIGNWRKPWERHKKHRFVEALPVYSINTFIVLLQEAAIRAYLIAVV